MAEQLTPEEAEAVAEAIPELTEAVRGLSAGFAALGGVIISATSALAGYYVADRRLKAKYAKIAEDEIEEMRVHFRARLVAREVKPEISSLGKKVEELGYVPPEPPPGAPNTAPGVEERDGATSNIFEEEKVDDHWDYETEKASRDESKPYVIHVDERGETGYEEITLTYYMGDDILCDHQDKVVDDQDRVVGFANLEKFGHGSNDASIVYVRNPYLNLDIEVVRSRQSYAEEVHGLKHADDPRRRERGEWQ